MFLTQNDKECRNEVMTKCKKPGNWEGKIWTDRVWRWGCLITAACNSYNTLFPQHDKSDLLTVKVLNKMIIKKKGYKYLAEPATCPESKASYLITSIVEKILGIKMTYFKDVKEYFTREDPNTEYIARVPHWKYGSGHMVNVLKPIGNDMVAYRDTDDANERTVNIKDIKYMYAVTRIK